MDEPGPNNASKPVVTLHAAHFHHFDDSSETQANAFADSRQKPQIQHNRWLARFRIKTDFYAHSCGELSVVTYNYYRVFQESH